MLSSEESVESEQGASRLGAESSNRQERIRNEDASSTGKHGEFIYSRGDGHVSSDRYGIIASVCRTLKESALLTGKPFAPPGKNEQVVGVRTYFGICFGAQAVVLTTGTFMNGQIWVGKSSQEAGRSGEAASHGLIELLNDLGFESGRLKTGTPARVDRRTIDFSVLEAQPGDAEVGWFSFDKSVHVPREQLCCYLTHTNHKTHNMIRV